MIEYLSYFIFVSAQTCLKAHTQEKITKCNDVFGK